MLSRCTRPLSRPGLPLEIAIGKRAIKSITCAFVLLACVWSPLTKADDSLLLDKVIATVNQELILHSDLEEVCNQLALEGKLVDASTRLGLLRELVLNKIFLSKAILHDVKIPKADIQRVCDARIASLIQRLGSEEKLVQAAHQSIYHFKKGLKQRVKAEYLASWVYQYLTQHVVVTPAEAAAYFNALPSHKRPYCPASVEVYQLVVYPKVGAARQEAVKNKLLHLKRLLLDTSHILQTMQPTEEEIRLAEVDLNKIRSKVVDGDLTFEAAVQQYSEDEETVREGGLIRANYQGGDQFPDRVIPVDGLSPDVYFVIDQLEAGSVSSPQYMGQSDRSGWRLLYLKQKVEAHPMNLKQDYEKIYYALLQQRRQEAVNKWIQTAKSEVVIDFAPEYRAVEQLL